MHEGENNPSNAYKILGLVELTDYPPFTLNMSRVDRFLQIPQVEILSPPLAAWFPGGATIFQICIRWPRPLADPSGHPDLSHLALQAGFSTNLILQILPGAIRTCFGMSSI